VGRCGEKKENKTRIGFTGNTAGAWRALDADLGEGQMEGGATTNTREYHKQYYKTDR